MDDELLSKFLSGRATDEEVARLRAEIEADPAAVDAVFDAAELERDLGEVFGAAVAPRRRRPFWIYFTSAAALLIAIVLAAMLLNDGPHEVARVAKVEGKSLRLGSAGRSPLAAGETLFAGDGIETNGRGRVVLRYEDGTSVELAPGTVAKDFAADGGKKIVLDRGTLTGDVVRQSADRPLVVRTREGEARVLGTRFTLSSSGGSTRLDVEKGRVRLTRLSDGKSADVAADQMALAAPGPAPTARPTAAAVLKMAPGTWLSVPDSTLEAVTPDPVKYAATRGMIGPAGVITAWSGGVFDSRRNRLVVWGGGYTDYAGNELYAFSTETMSWQRLTDPTAQPRLSQEENDDGTPNARATYNGLAYLSHADRLFALGGARAGSGYGCKVAWTFDFESKKWAKKTPSGPNPPGALGATCSYDAVAKKVWWGDTSGTYSLDIDADRWTKHNEDEFYYLTGAIDPKRGLWVVAGDRKLFAYDIRGGAPVRQAWKTTGGDSVLAKPNIGLDYDPVRDRIVAWAGGAVYALDPDTKTWTAAGATGAPPPTRNGIFGRWRYVPALDAFVAVTAAGGNVHFYKPAPEK